MKKENQVNIPSEWKGSKGKAIVSENFNGDIALVIGDNMPYFKTFIVKEFEQEDEAEYDAELFADSLNTIQKCGKLPSQLLEEKERLIAERDEAIKKNVWTSVTDELPDITGMYLTFSNVGERIKLTTFYSGSGTHHNGWDCFMPEEIRFWMKLPNKPQ